MKKFIYIFFIFCITFYICYYNYEWAGYISIYDIDDINSTYGSRPFLMEENGRYVCNILSRIVCVYIPKLLNIHFQDFVSTTGAFLYCIILNCLFFLSASFYFLFDKNRFLYLICVLFSFVTYNFLYFNKYCYSIYISLVSYQYGYVLAACFGFCFYFLLLRKILSDNIPVSYKTRNIVLFSIMAFCAGNSSQIISYSIFTAIFLNMIILLFFTKFKFKIFKEKYLRKDVFFPILCFCLGLLFMVSCPGFWQEVNGRRAMTLSQIYENFIPFIHSYIEVVIFYRLKYLCIIFILSIVLILKGILNKNIKKTFYVLCIAYSIIISIFSYYFLLFLASPSCVASPHEFAGSWVYEPFYMFFYILALCSVISFLLGCIFNDDKGICKTIFLIFLVLYCYSQRDTLKYTNFCYQKEVGRIAREVQSIVYSTDKYIIDCIAENKEINLGSSSFPIHGEGAIEIYFKNFYGLEINNKINYDEKYNNLIKPNNDIQKYHFAELQKSINQRMQNNI